MNSKHEYIFGLFPEINEIKQIGLRGLVADAWLLALEESTWKAIEDLPWIPGRVEFITNHQHCRGVTRIGLAISDALLASPDVAPDVIFDKDVVVASCILHDVGKLLEYPSSPKTPGEKTQLGQYMMHHILGTHIALKVGLPAEIVHCIESHREPESFVRSFEAKVVAQSDMLHAWSVLTAHPEISLP
jgi:putative nucleotidyltransferase with HDIG domain